MKVVVFGATGMVGQGVLRECQKDHEIKAILAVTRAPTGISDPKVKDLIHRDFLDFSSARAALTGYDACFYCLGVTSAGMSEPDYKRVTQDFTIAAAKVLAEVNPAMTFVFISGAGTDSTEKGGTMWARVKGATENALLKMPFKAKYMVRPGYIQPMGGIKSKTKMYAALYAVVGPLFPVIQAVFPKYVTTSERLGRAMILMAKKGAPKAVLEMDDVNALVP